MSMRVHVNPDLLAWASERAGLDVDALAVRFKKLPEWLRGEAEPTFKQLESFAKVTHAPLGYFFLPAPPEERVPIPDLRTLPGARRRPSPELLETLHICQERQAWCREFAQGNGEAPLAFVGSARLDDDAVEVAESIRSTLGFDLEARRQLGTWSDALRRFIEQADAAGIMVMCSGVVLNNCSRPLDPTEFRGFAMADEMAPLVFVNGKDSKAAQMFTLGHELAHIWLGQSAVSDADADRSASHDMERWCNQVAAELLVPLPKRSGGSFELTQAARVSKRFARALVASTLEGQTCYRDAYRLLGVRDQSAFEALGQSVGLS